MAQRLIFYTSDAEGITIGVSGQTWMECLLALSDEFGEGIPVLFEKTKAELEQLSMAVAESFTDEVEEIAANMAQAVMRQKADPDEETERAAEDSRAAVRAAIAASEVPDDAAPPDSGARQESLPDGDAVRPAGSETDPDAPTCEVCGATTTKDYATVTKLEYGEVRCPDCTP